MPSSCSSRFVKAEERRKYLLFFSLSNTFPPWLELRSLFFSSSALPPPAETACTSILARAYVCAGSVQAFLNLREERGWILLDATMRNQGRAHRPSRPGRIHINIYICPQFAFGAIRRSLDGRPEVRQNHQPWKKTFSFFRGDVFVLLFSARLFSRKKLLSL